VVPAELRLRRARTRGSMVAAARRERHWQRRRMRFFHGLYGLLTGQRSNSMKNSSARAVQSAQLLIPIKGGTMLSQRNPTLG
jgi:hypothetical protein